MKSSRTAIENKAVIAVALPCNKLTINGGGSMLKAILVAMVVAALLLVSGCGGSPEETQAQKAAAAKSKAREKAANERQQALAKKQRHQTAVYKECRRVAGPLDAKLDDLNSRLSVGLPFAKYSDLVGDAKVAYDKLIRDAKAQGGISDLCLNRVGTPLESGLNACINAYNTWNDCINATYCTFDKGTPSLKKAQQSWAKAGVLVNRADAALTGLRP